MSDHEERYELWPAFDSYIKKVIKSLNSEFTRQQKIVRQEKQTDTDVILEILNQKTQPHTDQYPIEYHTITVCGKQYALADEVLYLAMQQLPEPQLQVLILKYWMGYSEKEIATTLHISLRACYGRRQRAFVGLQKIIKENAHGQDDAP